MAFRALQALARNTMCSPGSSWHLPECGEGSNAYARRFWIPLSHCRESDNPKQDWTIRGGNSLCSVCFLLPCSPKNWPQNTSTYNELYTSTICCTLSRRSSTVFVNSGDRWKCMQWMLTTGVASIHSGMCREITQSSLGSNIHWRRSWICLPCSWKSLSVPTLLTQFFFVSTFELSIPGRSGLRPQCLFLTLLAEMFAGFPRQISKEDYSHAQQRNINATLKKMRFSLPCTGVMTAWISLSGPRNCGSWWKYWAQWGYRLGLWGILYGHFLTFVYWLPGFLPSILDIYAIYALYMRQGFDRRVAWCNE